MKSKTALFKSFPAILGLKSIQYTTNHPSYRLSNNKIHHHPIPPSRTPGYPGFFSSILSLFLVSNQTIIWMGYLLSLLVPIDKLFMYPGLVSSTLRSFYARYRTNFLEYILIHKFSANCRIRNLLIIGLWQCESQNTINRTNIRSLIQMWGSIQLSCHHFRGRGSTHRGFRASPSVQVFHSQIAMPH